jgi:transposase InsO family protein
MRKRNKPTPKAIALWRYEQIEEPLGVRSHDVRGPLLRSASRVPVTWPSGDVRPVSLASLYRWISLLEKTGELKALWPCVRKDKGTKKARIPKDVINAAAKLWSEDPDLSFTMLKALLYADPVLALNERSIHVSRSTLQRRLAEDPAYQRLKRARKRARHRRRFVARAAHEIWHVDAKGPVPVRLKSGVRINFHVLTILDDASRDVLAAIVAPTPDLAAAVRVFRLAAKRWGLPNLLYADRASIFDSPPFRAGLAVFGSHRINVRPKNPEANGKIEAYHRVLAAWFTGRLRSQKVQDLVHLEQLLWGMLEMVYRTHRHRGLKCSPKDALNDCVSARTVSAQALDDAFRLEYKKRAHPKTGEVDLPQGTFIVPEGLCGQRLTFLVDPERIATPLVLEPTSERRIALFRAAIRPEDRPSLPEVERWGEGPLQRLYDAWQGKVRPIAEPGFGLPEIFALLADAAGRPVPRSDAEAALVQKVYGEIGPLPKKATEAAMRRIRQKKGPGRPLTVYLDALERSVIPSPMNGPTKTKKRRSKR